ncbi:MAG TPA: hypothetical protein VIV11_20825 [Kofleriaceae bacterium]
MPLTGANAPNDSDSEGGGGGGGGGGAGVVKVHGTLGNGGLISPPAS